MTNSDFLILVNPNAGNKKPIKILPLVKKIFDSNKVNYDVFISNSSEELTAFLNKSKKFNKILILGGDGTINQVLEYVVENDNISVGILPVGSGNDMAKNLGFLPPFKEEYILNIINGTIRSVDICKCNNKYFCNELGIGFAAKVAHDYNSSPFLRGKAKYYFQIFKNILFYKSKELFISTPEKSYSEKVFLVSVGNGKTTGGGVPLTVNAKIDDGLMDVCLVKDLTILPRVENLMKALKGKHLDLPYVNYFRTNKILIESTEDIIAHMDGEMFKTNKLDISLYKQKLNVIFNPNFTGEK